MALRLYDDGEWKIPKKLVAFGEGGVAQDVKSYNRWDGINWIPEWMGGVSIEDTKTYEILPPAGIANWEDINQARSHMNITEDLTVFSNRPFGATERSKVFMHSKSTNVTTEIAETIGTAHNWYHNLSYGSDPDNIWFTHAGAETVSSVDGMQTFQHVSGNIYGNGSGWKMLQSNGELYRLRTIFSTLNQWWSVQIIHVNRLTGVATDYHSRVLPEMVGTNGNGVGGVTVVSDATTGKISCFATTSINETLLGGTTYLMYVEDLMNTNIESGGVVVQPFQKLALVHNHGGFSIFDLNQPNTSTVKYSVGSNLSIEYYEFYFRPDGSFNRILVSESEIYAGPTFSSYWQDDSLDFFRMNYPSSGEGILEYVDEEQNILASKTFDDFEIDSGGGVVHFYPDIPLVSTFSNTRFGVPLKYHRIDFT